MIVDGVYTAELIEEPLSEQHASSKFFNTLYSFLEFGDMLSKVDGIISLIFYDSAR